MANNLVPTISRATPPVVRRLAGLRRFDGSPPRTLSLFLDLDPAAFGTAAARASQINSVFSSANKALEGLDLEDRKALRKDLELVRSFFDESPDWASDAGSVAVFCSIRAELFEVLKVPVPLPQRVEVEVGPYIEPLVPLAQGDLWCVALVNRRLARVLLGNESLLREMTQVSDEVHGRHEQGGWSQARYERAIEKSVDAHLKHVADELLNVKRRFQFSRLLVGTTEELWPRLKSFLHDYVRQSFAARIDIDVENSLTDQVRKQLEQVAAIESNAKEKALLERLRSELGRNRRAVSGLGACLARLNFGRVEVLLVDARVQTRAGAYCAKCSWLGTTESSCPRDGSSLERTDDVLEKALECAMVTSADIITFKFHKDLQPLGGVAALLRF